MGNFNNLLLDEGKKKIFEGGHNSIEFVPGGDIASNANLTDNDLLDYYVSGLYEFHPTHELHKEIRNHIRTLLSDPKYLEEVFVYRTVHHPEYETLQSFDVMASNTETFVNDPTYLVKSRREVEYNLEYRQLVVCAIIVDENKNLIVLKTTDNGTNRIQDKLTMVQGHVSFSKEAYIMSQVKYLRENIKRELEEELNINGEINITELIEATPSFIIDIHDDFSSLEHHGFVYVLNVPNCEEFMANVKSNESEKHSVVYLANEDIKDSFENMDTWLQLIVEVILDKSMKG